MYISIFLFVLIASVLAAALTPAKPHEKLKLEKASMILIPLLAILYVPISYMSIITGAFATDSPNIDPQYIGIRAALIKAAAYLAITVPFASPVSLSTSAILMKRGKAVAGFIVQFVPLVLFAAIVIALIIIG